MAYIYNYLGLVNRVLSDFNEVQLTTGTFSSAVGFQTNVLNYVNDALLDIYNYEDIDWPFLWQHQTFQTTIGVGNYTVPSTVQYPNWNSFEVQRTTIPITSLTQSGGVATCTVASGHTLVSSINGISVVDLVIVQGVTNDTGFDGQFTPTIVSPTVFTYTCSASASTGTGTSMTIIPPPNNQFLALKDWGEYMRDWRDVDVNGALQYQTSYSPPRFISRRPDNNIQISPYPDRIYTVGYDAFLNPNAFYLTNPTDVPILPDSFRQVIIDRANIYALAFRDNDVQLARNDTRFVESCDRMRRILIPANDFIVFKN